MVSIPSARGISPYTASCLLNMKDVLAAHGHKMHLGVLHRVPLDAARNELTTSFLSTPCEVQLWLDDDCWIEPVGTPTDVMLLIDAIEAGGDIVSAPCRMRNAGAAWHPFNVSPSGHPERLGNVRVIECDWTGFGCVAIARRVVQGLYDNARSRDKTRQAQIDAGADPATLPEQELYASAILPGSKTAALFRSRVVPAATYQPDAPSDLGVYILDDKVYSLAARQAGFRIHAAIDVHTSHDGMTGCFADDLENLLREQAAAGAPGAPTSAASDGKVARAPMLIDNFGRPMRGGK